MTKRQGRAPPPTTAAGSPGSGTAARPGWSAPETGRAAGGAPRTLYVQLLELGAVLFGIWVQLEQEPEVASKSRSNYSVLYQSPTTFRWLIIDNQ